MNIDLIGDNYTLRTRGYTALMVTIFPFFTLPITSTIQYSQISVQ
jgi:hypothetical protein